MQTKDLLKTKTARLIAFLWFIVFPILFIAIPVMEMVLGERDTGYDPLWAFGVWILGPWAAWIILKYSSRHSGAATQNPESRAEKSKENE